METSTKTYWLVGSLISIPVLLLIGKHTLIWQFSALGLLVFVFWVLMIMNAAVNYLYRSFK